MIYVLYNQTAGAHYGVERISEKMRESFPGEQINLTDAISVENKGEFIKQLTADDRLVIVGGDGTLNHFVNEIEDKEFDFPIYCFAAGSGNDFINDVVGVDSDIPIMINDYIKHLPIISVDGKEHRFINGAGYGIDGYCCEEGNKKRDKNGKGPNYTKIALKGLLYAFKPLTAKVTIDGVTTEYKNVWMVPTMNGRYLGGGMMLTPEQDRLNSEHKVSVVVVTSKSRLKLLTVFPKIFKGNHVKHTDVFKAFTGKSVSVEFDSPTAMQIDGETISNVKSYTVSTFVEKKSENDSALTV
jgi:diacylglycerol kinase family enzyme